MKGNSQLNASIYLKNYHVHKAQLFIKLINRFFFSLFLFLFFVSTREAGFKASKRNSKKTFWVFVNKTRCFSIENHRKEKATKRYISMCLALSVCLYICICFLFQIRGALQVSSAFIFGWDTLGRVKNLLLFCVAYKTDFILCTSISGEGVNMA